MAEALLRAAAFACSFCGMAWFALAKKAHWQEICGPSALLPRAARYLHLLGVTAVAVSLLLGLWVDHASMATLVWVMTLTAAGLLVTLVLAWRPRSLAWLVAWLR